MPEAAPPCPDEWATTAHMMADKAGAIARRYFRRPLAVDSKADASPVTVADREIESLLRDIIAKKFPDHGILGEEFGHERRDAEITWVLDPIDGTRSFVAGVPLFGTLIAVTCAGRPILGLIDQPILRERWFAVAGGGARHNGKPIRSRNAVTLGEAHMYAGDFFDAGPDQGGDEHRRLRRAVRMVRYNGDCYAHGLLAMGQLDLVLERGLEPYDFCALVPVIGEAGGHIADWQGRPLDLHSAGDVLSAGSRALHDAARAVMAG